MTFEPREANNISLCSSGLSAGSERVSNKPSRTGADSSMIACLTLRILSTGILTRRSAVIVKTCTVQWTLAIIDTLPSRARYQRVPPISRRAGAHRPVSPRPVKPSLALSTGTTGVRSAQVLLLKRSAADKRVPGISSWTGAHCFMVGSLTGCSLPAHIRVRVIAGVPALQLDTGLVRGAVIVPGALCVAPGERVAQEIRRTGALCTVVHSLAVCILPTGATATRILTAVLLPVTSL